MKDTTFTVLRNETIGHHLYKMTVQGDTSAIERPGQFVNVLLAPFYLRRPFCVYDWDDTSFSMIYRIAGEGTDYMSKLEPGHALDILTGLGNGFCVEKAGKQPLMVAGGAGVPALFRLAKALLDAGSAPALLLGFRNAQDFFLPDDFAALPLDVRIATEDGSMGHKGLVTELLADFPQATYFYGCGPLPMLKAVCAQTTIPGEVSLESRMGCGFGACMGCSIKTVHGPKRVCKEGPVFAKEEIIW